MSIEEIKEEIRRMSREQRKEIARLLLEVESASQRAGSQAETFAEAKNYVFDNYGDLLRRLAEQPTPREVKPGDADVPAAMDAVFEKHKELLGRLAQS